MADASRFNPIPRLTSPADRLLAVAGALLISFVPLRAAEPGPAAIGDVTPELRFKDIRYLPRTLKDLGEQNAYVLVFTQDTWIIAAEILPDNPKIVHHCNMGHFTIGKSFSEGNFITGRVPGGTPLVADDGVALRIPKNSVVGLQIHYTTTGKPEKNRMSVGFKFPKGIVHKELKHLQVTTSDFVIPPGAPAHPVVSSRTLPADASGIGIFSHMHLRGKDMAFIAHSPTGEKETLLSIPNYNYAWQQNYRWEPGKKKFPKGTRIEVIAHYDNSPFNPWNPDPKAEVRNGPQTFHEMMFGFFFYTEDREELNLHVDPKTGHPVQEPAVTPAADGTR
ncbi:MAG: hypothetical protein ACM3U2_22735 [Deltaproteobacteria bacterium]